MEKSFLRAGLAGALLALCVPAVRGSDQSRGGPDREDKAPSRDKVLWMGSPFSYLFEADYGYLAGLDTDLGNGTRGVVREQHSSIKAIGGARMFRAFLLQSGFQWERYGFGSRGPNLIPDQLSCLGLFASLNARLSRKDMLVVQTSPGLYWDMHGTGGDDFHVPVDYAYVHVFSERLQIYLSASDNSWRKNRWLPGAGFRWRINDRWKLAFLMPQPMVVYRAGETLHLGFGADLRGDSYHVNDRFGDDAGRSELNGSLVDFQEVRVGPNFSWNVRPLIEINGWVGSIVNRQFGFHNGDVKLTSRAGPFVMLNVAMLFEVEELERFPYGQERVPRVPRSLFNRVFR